MIQLWKDFLAYLPGLWQHRWWGLATALVVGVLGACGTLLLPDRYEATARVQLDTQSILKPLMVGLAVQPNADQQVQMMARTLVSRPNVERVAEMANLSSAADSARHDRVVQDLLKDIQFKPSGGSNFYSVAYRDRSPETARKVVESLLEIFNETNIGDQRRDTEQARKFIDEQLAQYEKRLVEAENALKEFKVRNLSMMPNLAQDYVARTTEAQKELAQAKLELRQLESSREALKRQLADERPAFETPTLDAGAGGLSMVGGAMGSAALPGESRLEAARKQLDQLLVRFTDEHPDVINLRRSIAEMEQRQAQAEAKQRSEKADAPRPGSVLVPNKVYQDIKIALADTESKIAALKAKVAEAGVWLAEARHAAQTVPKVEAEYTQLTRDYEVNKRSYDQLLQRRESAEISGSMSSGSGIGAFRIVDPPWVGQRPASPNRPLLLAGVLVMSVVAGLAMALFRDAAAPTFRDPGALRATTGLPILGVVTRNIDALSKARARRGALVFSSSAMLYLGLFVLLIAFQLLRFMRA